VSSLRYVMDSAPFLFRQLLEPPLSFVLAGTGIESRLLIPGL
jgi:hypothetical protein